MTRRKLGSDELDLWKTVAASATPLPRSMTTPQEKPTSKPVIGAPKFEASVGGSKLGIGSQRKEPQTSVNRSPSITDTLHQAPVTMDNKTFKKLKRGKLRPEARLDLHGLRVHEAQPDLTSFVLRSYAAGKRLVLVITGKGRKPDDDGPIPTRVGILRHEVPRWLSSAPLSSCVQQVLPANDRDGGSGAYYVYLRRKR